MFWIKTFKIDLRVSVFAVIVFFLAITFVSLAQPAISRGMDYTYQESANNPHIIPVIKTTNSSTITASAPEKNNAAASVLGSTTYDFSSTKIGIYTGPGSIGDHNTFEAWLGKSVPYATDYIDYRWGWAIDFQNSASVLAKQWGGWVAQGDRRLVLGVPMLENSDAGQFDRGINGNFDVYYKNLASQLIQNNLGNSIIRLGYEGNYSGIGPWQATDNPTGYKLLFRHEAAVMSSVSGANFQFDWTVCNGMQSGHALSTFDSFYPGDDVVKIIGTDTYDFKWQDTSATPQERWNFIVSQPMGVNDLIAFAKSHGKPISFPEWGMYAAGNVYGGGGDDPYYIEKMADLFMSTKPIYQSYFDVNWGGGALSDFPQGQTAYKQIFSQ